jgi:hypothetical protein
MSTNNGHGENTGQMAQSQKEFEAPLSHLRETELCSAVAAEMRAFRAAIPLWINNTSYGSNASV